MTITNTSSPAECREYIASQFGWKLSSAGWYKEGTGIAQGNFSPVPSGRDIIDYLPPGWRWSIEPYYASSTETWGERFVAYGPNEELVFIGRTINESDDVTRLVALAWQEYLKEA